MSREMLFKAKHIHAMDSNEHLNGTWVHGYLSDKNYIYDIIKYHFGEVYAPVKFGEYQSCFDNASTIHVGFYVDWNENHDFRKDLGYWIKLVDAEVVGNIFDNPELLEEENKHGKDI